LAASHRPKNLAIDKGGGFDDYANHRFAGHSLTAFIREILENPDAIRPSFERIILAKALPTPISLRDDY